MGFVFMVFHYPAPGQREAFADSMREMATVFAGLPGLVDVGPPWYDAETDALVGISRWESREAFQAAMAQDDTEVTIPPERAPRQRFLLDEL